MLEQETELPSFSDAILETLARHIGASPETTKQALDAALPASMYAIADRGSTEDGARRLLDGMARGELPALDTDELRRRLADPELDDRSLFADDRLAEEIFGDRRDLVLDDLASLSDIDRDGVRKIVAVAAPLAMGIVGRRAHTERRDAGGLARFLAEEKPSVAMRLPESMRSTLVSRRRTGPPRPPRIWPWMLSVAAAVTLIFSLPSLNLHPTPNMTPPEDFVDTTPAPSASPSVRRLFAALHGDSSLPARWTIEEISFAPGESAMPPGARSVVAELVPVLAAHPEARIRLEGAGDTSAGTDAELELARRRAIAMRRDLIGAGISPELIVASAGKDPTPGRIDLVLVERSASK